MNHLFFNFVGYQLFIMLPERYFVVIFTTERTSELEGYEEMNDKTFELVETQPGFLGADSFSNDEGRHVTIVKFETQEDIMNWRNNSVHQEAQRLGREKWYKYYNVKVCQVEREYEFFKEKP